MPKKKCFSEVTCPKTSNLVYTRYSEPAIHYLKESEPAIGRSGTTKHFSVVYSWIKAWFHLSGLESSWRPPLKAINVDFIFTNLTSRCPFHMWTPGSFLFLFLCFLNLAGNWLRSNITWSTGKLSSRNLIDGMVYI